jgi:hypothetical protein
MQPIIAGDANNIVVILQLSREGLEFLAESLPYRDGFTRELQELLAEVDRTLAAEVEAS